MDRGEWCKVLSDGTVFFDYGPVSMTVFAESNSQPLTELCCRAFEVVETALKEIASSLSVLKLYWPQIPAALLNGIPLRMYESVKAVGEPTLTPMAAVAGAVSDAVADWLFSRGTDRVMVNNGGDIALRLAREKSVRVGIVSSLAAGKVDKTLTVNANDRIGGIATSGLGGRSFTRGVSEGVTAFARSGALADALATHLANTSFVESPRVQTEKAGIQDPDSDIRDLEVVTGVEMLTEEEKEQSLMQVYRESCRQKENGTLLGLFASVQGRCLSLDLSVTDIKTA